MARAKGAAVKETTRLPRLMSEELRARCRALGIRPATALRSAVLEWLSRQRKVAT